MQHNQLTFSKSLLVCLTLSMFACGPASDHYKSEKGVCFEVFGPSNLSHSDPAHDFGQVLVGKTGELAVRFYNFCNDETATVLSAELVDPKPDSPFQLAKAPEIGSLVGTQVINSITFTPAAAGTFSAVFRFTVSHGYYEVKLTGEAIAAYNNTPGHCFEVFGPSNQSHSDPAHDFGQVQVGKAGELSVRFYNFCNDETATVLSAELVDPKPDAPFQLTNTPKIGSLVGTQVINSITFTPAAAGTFSAVFRFTVSHGYYEVKLTGEAI